MDDSRVALVTGASSGIGLAAARALASRGMRVVMVARTEATLAAAARDIGELAIALPLDVTDRAALAALPARVVERCGRLDVVVNSAGVNHRGPVHGLTAAQLAGTIETNLVAPMLLMAAAAPHLPRGGVVVNVASLAGKVPLPDEAAYSSSKAGLRWFARALHVELAPAGVRVCTVNPGPVETGFLGRADEVLNVPPLVFSQPMSSAERIAAAILRAVDGGPQEIDVPATSGALCTLGYLFPPLFHALRPLLERRGRRNRARYAARLATHGILPPSS